MQEEQDKRATLAYQRDFDQAVEELQNPDGPQTPELAEMKTILQDPRGYVVAPPGTPPISNERIDELIAILDEHDRIRRPAASHLAGT